MTSKNLWYNFLLELLILAKNATLKDVLDEIKKNRKFSKNEALFCKQQETEKIDGAKKFVEMFPWILTFNRFHIKTLCKHDYWILKFKGYSLYFHKCLRKIISYLMRRCSYLDFHIKSSILVLITHQFENISPNTIRDWDWHLIRKVNLVHCRGSIQMARIRPKGAKITTF